MSDNHDHDQCACCCGTAPEKPYHTHATYCPWWEPVRRCRWCGAALDPDEHDDDCCGEGGDGDYNWIRDQGADWG